MSNLQELRVVSAVLGTAVVVALLPERPTWAPVALVPWLVTTGLLWSRRGSAILSGLVALRSRLAGRMALVAVAILGLFTAVLAGINPAVTVFSWLAAAAVAAAAVLEPSRFREGFADATLATVVFTALCALVEAGLRLPEIAERFETPQARARWERAYDHLELRNPFHMRSRHTTVARVRGTRRILVTGDSYTWGDKILTADSVWPALLEDELLRRSPALPTEVVNLSQRGWNTVQEADALDRIGWQFSPDRLLVQFYANDAGVSRKEQGGAAGQMRMAGEALREAPIARSALLWVLRHRFTSRTGDDLYRFLLESYRDEAPGWLQMQRALHRMADSARARGVPITLVLFPDFPPGSWTPASHPLTPIHRKVADVAAAEGFDVLDITQAYADEGGDWRRWWATAYDRHPSAAADLVAARAIADHLAAVGWPADDAPARAVSQ
ncbi:MAG TPA: SGNH/GDSL hydrolase family protein [Gemmatimonadales bacterium]